MRPSTRTQVPTDGPNLAEALGGIADRYLNLDVLDHSQDVTRYVGYLLDTIHSLESRLYYNNARDLKMDVDQKPPGKEEKVPCWRVLHRVICSVSWHSHACFTFEDEPKYQLEAADEHKGLHGKVEVRDIRYYAEQRPEIVFIVIKEHECGQSTRFRRDGEERLTERRETMQIFSTTLNEALRSIAMFEPYEVDPSGRGLFVGMMEAPYLFLFHHYQKLHDLADRNKSYKPVLDPLIQFLDRNYLKEYLSAHELFRRGFVTAYHADKLYKPFEPVIIRDSGKKVLRAGVLLFLPEKIKMEKKRWNLDGWSWTYNGREARRELWNEYTDPFQAEEIPISKLRIYPLKYAKAEDIEKIRETGRRFWNMRHQGLRCYTGWDEKHDRHYVCLPI